ncbi:hypothetical protein H3C66_03100 [Patescibacteria group bacterium]|nr:hypothetical protein [Patescibacteria group bacterium]
MTRKETSRGRVPLYDLTRAESTGVLPADVVKAALLDTLKISAETHRIAAKLMHLTSDYQQLNVEVNRPGMLEFVRDNPDLMTMARLGFYSRIILAVQELERAAQEFIDNPRNSPIHSHVVKRYKNSTEYSQYFTRYNMFAPTVRVMVENTDSQYALWMTRMIPPTATDEYNQFGVAAETQKLGQIVVNHSHRKAKQDRRGVKAAEYRDLAQLFVPVVRYEAEEQPLILSSEKTSKEQLARIFFDLINTYELRLTHEELKKIPAFLQEAVKQGIPLYQLFCDFLTELPNALANPHHAGHLATLHLVSELNRFQVEARGEVAEFHAQMFNYHLAAGLIEKDFNGSANYQQFVYNLSRLAESDDPNAAWYQAVSEYFIKGSKHFEYQIACEAADIPQRIFDSSRNIPSYYAVGDKIEEILQTGNYDTVQLLVGDELYPIEKTLLRGKQYTSFFFVERTGEESYGIDVQVAITTDGQTQDGEAREETIKFRCRVDVIKNQLFVHLPVANKHVVSYDTELAIIQHVRQMFGLVNIEEVRKTDEEQLTQQSTQVGQKGDRQRRKKEYAERKAAMSPEQRDVNIQPTALKKEVSPGTAVEREESYYFPQILVFDRDLWDEVKNPGAKGRFVRIAEIIKAFTDEYNMATKDKPGKGIRLAEVRGPNGEPVWRFKSSHDTRCFVVGLPNGIGWVVHVDDRGDVYDDKHEMRRMIAAIMERRTQEDELRTEKVAAQAMERRQRNGSNGTAGK